MLAWQNAGDHPTAQRLADRLALAWFNCDGATLAQQQPPEGSIFELVEGFPCTVKMIISEPEHPLKRLVTDQAAKELANGLQNSLDKLRQMQSVQGRQEGPTAWAIFADTS